MMFSMSKFYSHARAALADLGTFAEPRKTKSYPHRNVSEALGSDWARIGADMNRVVEREYEKAPQIRRAPEKQR